MKIELEIAGRPYSSSCSMFRVSVTGRSVLFYQGFPTWGGGWGGTHPHRDALLPLWRLVPPHPPPYSRPIAKSVRETLGGTIVFCNS